MEKPWKEIQKEFGIGAGVFLFLMLIFLIKTKYEIIGLESKELVVVVKPYIKEQYFKGRTSYSIEVYFVGESSKYEISGADYKYLEHEKFMNDIQRTDTVKILTSHNEILSFSKNGVEYMNFKKALLRKKEEQEFNLGFLLTGLIICSIPLFFKEKPTFFILGITVPVRFGWILFISLLLAGLLLPH